jgi:glycopeptide antibiotics resistance protein
VESLPRDAGALVVGVVAIALIGLFALAWWLRRDPRAPDVDTGMRTVILAGAIGVVMILTLTPRDIGESGEVLLVPFQSILGALTGPGSVRAALLEPIQNIVLFIPLGLALQWRFTGLSVTKVTLVALAVSAAIEVLQGVLATGRTANVTDVIMNTLGGFTGAVAAGWLGLTRSSEG